MALMATTSIDLVNGDVLMQEERYTFEFVEELYKQIKPYLEKRRTDGVQEGKARTRISTPFSSDPPHT